jgi:hypothetical protein
MAWLLVRVPFATILLANDADSSPKTKAKRFHWANARLLFHDKPVASELQNRILVRLSTRRRVF